MIGAPLGAPILGVGALQCRAEPHVVVEILGHGDRFGRTPPLRGLLVPAGRRHSRAPGVDALELADVLVARELAGEAEIAARALLRSVLEDDAVAVDQGAERRVLAARGESVAHRDRLGAR